MNWPFNDTNIASFLTTPKSSRTNAYKVISLPHFYSFFHDFWRFFKMKMSVGQNVRRSGKVKKQNICKIFSFAERQMNYTDDDHHKKRKHTKHSHVPVLHCSFFFASLAPNDSRESHLAIDAKLAKPVGSYCFRCTVLFCFFFRSHYG